MRIALPVKVEETVVGAINIIIFQSSFQQKEAETSLLGALRKCVMEVEATFTRLEEEFSKSYRQDFAKTAKP
jgi:DNA-binding IclR family transcriptional regulator